MQTTTGNTGLADAERTQFAEEGYLILRGFLAPAILEEAQAAINELVSQHADRLVATGKRTDRLADASFRLRLLKLYEDNLDEAPVIFRSQLHLPGLFPLFFHIKTIFMLIDLEEVDER